MWRELIDFYFEHYKIDPTGIKLLCSFDILELIANGKSNSEIVEETGITLEEVLKISNDYFAFDGWEEPLDFSPIKEYNRVTNKYAYTQILTWKKEYRKMQVLMSWDVVEKFKRLERKFYSYD